MRRRAVVGTRRERALPVRENMVVCVVGIGLCVYYGFSVVQVFKVMEVRFIHYNSKQLDN